MSDLYTFVQHPLDKFKVSVHLTTTFDYLTIIDSTFDSKSHPNLQ